MVDIGTNSMRLLITDGVTESGRWVQVTGLGKGVDATGVLAADALERTLVALSRFGEQMDLDAVDARAAVATSATRDAVNREEFLDQAEIALGVRPDVISGEREGALSFAGATSDLSADDWVVSDIGGGSTEFVTRNGAVSIDIGSVRLTDRVLPDRPSTAEEVERAKRHVASLFSSIRVRGPLVGVAGTWTSLAAIDLGLPRYDRASVHHHRLDPGALAAITSDLARRTLAETESIPSLDPKRAPVILAGAVVAGGVLDAVEAQTVLVSEQDSLDGLAAELLAVTSSRSQNDPTLPGWRNW